MFIDILCRDKGFKRMLGVLVLSGIQYYLQSLTLTTGWRAKGIAKGMNASKNGLQCMNKMKERAEGDTSLLPDPTLQRNKRSYKIIKEKKRSRTFYSVIVRCKSYACCPV